MRYLIGAVFGIVLVLLLFGATTYYNYHQSQRLQESSQQQSKIKPLSSVISRTATPKNSGQSNYRNSHGYPNHQSKVINKRHSVSSRQDPKLYTWKDKNGNKVISSRPPATGSYQKLTLPEEGLSVVEMEKVKSTRNKKDNQPRRYAFNSASPAVIKQQLISKNNGKCRWLVGRAYERYIKILEHSGSNQSVHCDEHSERLREMRKLAQEGTGCYYPYSTPTKC